ncbi:hypothetical protein SAMN05446935_2351 [Burkholderia sp. YR290]|nr:hypothetical protein PMI06_006451 [Burkholderia sp. BT03]SKC62658.1 hypothetical protein SAMN05446934_1167 [Paraburkholderia hospita]SKC94117.1 hypothetical protein SAMN06266956_5986 [Paraburkholderia hospita]SOE63779.1 hypothetical protein SAMN05446935_2351 [Burkholderia sp. YR290]
MHRTHLYKSCMVRVTVEPHAEPSPHGPLIREAGFTSIVGIFDGSMAGRISPLRVTDADGGWFGTEADALMHGFSAGQRIVDDSLRGTA